MAKSELEKFKLAFEDNIESGKIRIRDKKAVMRYAKMLQSK
jgi:hypothetical protein